VLNALHGPALGKRRAPPELLTGIAPSFSAADNQCTAAFRALPLGCWGATAFEVLHMLAVGGERRRAAAGLQSLQHGVHFSLAEDRLLE